MASATWVTHWHFFHAGCHIAAPFCWFRAHRFWNTCSVSSPVAICYIWRSGMLGARKYCSQVYLLSSRLVGFEGLGIQSEGPAMKGRVKMPRLELARWMSLLFTAVVHWRVPGKPDMRYLSVFKPLLTPYLKRNATLFFAVKMQLSHFSKSNNFKFNYISNIYIFK